ncbi:hypothetical protein FDUTEX481_05044 [Tolypothrix sp. PCC 7601]|nr:hypothetical protein FDUTEX481_05044 [Tolypothrix sp. PCC 7601]
MANITLLINKKIYLNNSGKTPQKVKNINRFQPLLRQNKHFHAITKSVKIEKIVTLFINNFSYTKRYQQIYIY